jgi:hypothetical protein
MIPGKKYPEEINDYIDFTHLIAAFVTPRAPAVEQILQTVKTDHPECQWSNTLGDADENSIRAKVRAIYETLEKLGFKYDDSLQPAGSLYRFQIIRLPSQTLKEHKGNCVDLSVLFASILECASIFPLIILMNYHAFTGWEFIADGEYHREFIDACYYGHPGKPLDFPTALLGGDTLFKQIIAQGILDKGFDNEEGYARIINITQRHRDDIEEIMPMEP